MHVSGGATSAAEGAQLVGTILLARLQLFNGDVWVPHAELEHNRLLLLRCCLTAALATSLTR